MDSMIMNESIYNLIPREEVKVPKAKKHTSKFKETVKVEEKVNKKPAKTMGPAEVVKPKPDKFLKKHEREPILPERRKFEYSDADRKKPAVPTTKDEPPLLGLKTTKNFITKNAVETIMSVPGKPEKKYADTRIGDTHNLIPSGLEPKFIHKRDYGDVPVYLKKRQDEMARAQEEYNAYIAESFKKGAMKQLSESERNSIITGLKTNWEDLYHQYQGLSVVTDTLPKKHRKERLENEMKQLERDIQMIEKHCTVYISN